MDREEVPVLVKAKSVRFVGWVLAEQSPHRHVGQVRERNMSGEKQQQLRSINTKEGTIGVQNVNKTGETLSFQASEFTPIIQCLVFYVVSCFKLSKPLLLF